MITEKDEQTFNPFDESTDFFGNALESSPEMNQPSETYSAVAPQVESIDVSQPEDSSFVSLSEELESQNEGFGEIIPFPPKGIEEKKEEELPNDFDFSPTTEEVQPELTKEVVDESKELDFDKEINELEDEGRKLDTKIANLENNLSEVQEGANLIMESIEDQKTTIDRLKKEAQKLVFERKVKENAEKAKLVAQKEEELNNQLKAKEQLGNEKRVNEQVIERLSEYIDDVKESVSNNSEDQGQAMVYQNAA